MHRHGIAKVNFKGFMADNAQANWNAVRIIYGSGDPKVPIQECKRTCYFHWTQSNPPSPTAFVGMVRGKLEVLTVEEANEKMRRDKDQRVHLQKAAVEEPSVWN